MDIPAVIGLGALLAFIPADIARKKSHSFFSWWVFGLLFLPGAFITALLVGPAAATQPEVEPIRLHHRLCPDCAERVRRETKVCRHCGTWLPHDLSPLAEMTPDERDVLDDRQKFIIETAGYLLAPEDAETAWKLLVRGGQIDRVAELFLTRSRYVD